MLICRVKIVLEKHHLYWYFCFHLPHYFTHKGYFTQKNMYRSVFVCMHVCVWLFYYQEYLSSLLNCQNCWYQQLFILIQLVKGWNCRNDLLFILIVTFFSIVLSSNTVLFKKIQFSNNCFYFLGRINKVFVYIHCTVIICLMMAFIGGK